MDLIPLKATFALGEPIAIEIVASAPGKVAVFHLDRLVGATELAAAQTRVELDPLPMGGYGLEVETAEGIARTAFDVLPDPLARPRYGFVSRYERGRDIAGVAANVRRLHLNAVQFYDWMYRHAKLLPPSTEYDDPLGRSLSLATVRALTAALTAAGSLSFAYAAVYGVGREEWPQWQAAGLYRADGTPWTLGDDFLWIVDPSDERWLAHLTAQLRDVGTCGFAGFHLDQYGDPKRARRHDGSAVDLERAFPHLIDIVRDAIPQARLIFNNVNNYPTWATARSAQDAIYIEVWAPHTRLEHLARLIRDARALADKPVILAAYLSVFDSASEDEAIEAARLTMATIFSHGGSHLLAGEDGAVLTDPYYVRHHTAPAATRMMLRHWYDFAVRYGDVLYDPGAIDVTTALTGGINEDVTVEADVPVSVDPEPGSIWVRVVATDAGLVLHLIDLSAETDTTWDAPKKGRDKTRDVRVRIRRITSEPPRVQFASPEALPALTPSSPSTNGGYDVYEVPAWRSWAIGLVRP